MGAVMSDESAKQLIASGRKRSLRMKGLSFPQAIGDGCVMGDLAALAETALANLAKMTEERDALKNDTSGSRLISAFMRMQTRVEAAESALARLKAQGTFAEGIEAAAKVAEDAYTRHEKYPEVQCPDARVERGELVYYLEASPDDIAARIRALAPPKPAEEPQS